MLAEARALDGEEIRAGHDPVERCVVVEDVLQAATEVREELPDLLLAGGQSPLREEDLRIIGKEIHDAAAIRRHALVVEGLQVLERITSDVQLRATPTVVLTSSREEADLLKSYKLGVNAYVVKPDIEGLIETVNKLLSEKQCAAAS